MIFPFTIHKRPLSVKIEAEFLDVIGTSLQSFSPCYSQSHLLTWYITTSLFLLRHPNAGARMPCACTIRILAASTEDAKIYLDTIGAIDRLYYMSSPNVVCVHVQVECSIR
jgi:hypothetical protein